MLKNPKEIIPENEPSVGVLVGRFQVSELTDGHKALFDSVIARHTKTICIIGLSQLKATKSNPLDFEARRKMISEVYPNINIFYIKDTAENPRWSSQLDEIISTHTPPSQKVVLYGSRDSFIKYYSGRYATMELIQESFVSGTEDRLNNAFNVSDSKDFRKGVIWATQNQYDSCFPTVDIAIYNPSNDAVLLARKPHESKFRFVGGFVDPKGDTSKPSFLEMNAKREVIEETHVETDNYKYIGSFLVDDWRYRSERSKIVTTLFEATYIFGTPTPDDDICELRYLYIKDLHEYNNNNTLGDYIVNEHIPLMKLYLTTK